MKAAQKNKSDVFVMCGLMVDAYYLRKTTSEFNNLFEEIYDQNPNPSVEFKTHQFVKGRANWNVIGPPTKRWELIRKICEQVAEKNSGHKIFGIAFSFKAFESAVKIGYKQPFNENYWLGAAMFTMCLVQKKMQREKRNKGHTVVIMDSNTREMVRFQKGLYQASNWFDGLYKTQIEKRGKAFWKERSEKDRFDQIINAPFGIESRHSYLIQVADVVSYIYRRHLEWQSGGESQSSEKQPHEEEERLRIAELVEILKGCRQKLGTTPDEPCRKFYRKAKHPGWDL